MLEQLVSWLDEPSSRLFVWGLMARGLAFILFVSQCSLAAQIIPLGMLPLCLLASLVSFDDDN
jgi:hypothetical protein